MTSIPEYKESSNPHPGVKYGLEYSQCSPILATSNPRYSYRPGIVRGMVEGKGQVTNIHED